MNRAITAIAIAVVFVGGMFFAGVPVEAKKGGGGNDEQPGILDIKPGSCPNPINLGSNGVTLVAILGSDTLDVNDIDTSVFPEDWRIAFEDVGAPFVGEFESIDSCTEADPDGYLDLTIKIPSEVFLILCIIPDQSGVILGLRVQLLDGTDFVIWDVVKTLKKNNNPCF